MTKKIGVTGGIGSGKSLVCDIFRRLGAPVYQADDRAKYLMTTDHELISQIKKEFGDLSYLNSGALNREFLGKVVFNDSVLLKKLNGLVHPRVAVDFKDWVRKHNEHMYVLKEAALLFDSGAYQDLDGVIVVSAPEQIRIKRVLKRDKSRSEVQIKQIMEHQMKESDMISRAQFTIVNDESCLVIPQVLALHKKFSQ